MTLPLGDAYGYTPTRLDVALDAAVAAENADPQGLPADDLAFLEQHPGVRAAFRNAAKHKGLPDPFPEDGGEEVSVRGQLEHAVQTTAPRDQS